MNDAMGFPETVEEFMESYKMTDTEHIYSNGIEYVPIFRMKQWFEHIKGSEEKRAGWIKTSERLPKPFERVLGVFQYADEMFVASGKYRDIDRSFVTDYEEEFWIKDVPFWMPLPEPPEVEE